MAVIYGRADAEKRLLDGLPDEVKTVDDIRIVHKEMKQEFDSIEDKGLGNKFKRWKKKRQINKIEERKKGKWIRGAKGELEVIDKLSELDDIYHVLCGVRMDLGRYITYHGRKNLRSSQMDFVVVSKKGIVLIEAKNWGNSYVEKNKKKGMTPHEQVDRAGMVLWIALKSWFSPRNPQVTKVVLANRGNIQYDPEYKFVNVKNMDNINSFIQSRYEIFSDKEVERVVGRIKGHVAK